MLKDNIQWEEFLNRIPESKKVQALSTCIVRSRISFCNELEAIRFVINITDNFNSLIKKAESKETEKTATYLQSVSLVEEFEDEYDERAEEKKEAENTVKAAKDASNAATKEVSTVKNHVYKTKNKLLVKWKKSLQRFANREFNKLADVLFPIATELDKNSDEVSEDEDGVADDIINDNKGPIGESGSCSGDFVNDNDEDDEDTEETYKKRKRESDDENEDEEDDECGPAYFNLTDLNSYPKKRLVSLLEEVDSLTSILQDDCMSSKDPSSNFIVLQFHPSNNFQRRVFAKQVVWFQKGVGLDYVYDCKRFPAVQNIL